jgi:hypothetical protein
VDGWPCTFASADIVYRNLPYLCLVHGLDVSVYQVCDMDVITNACAVRSVVVLSSHLAGTNAWKSL